MLQGINSLKIRAYSPVYLKKGGIFSLFALPGVLCLSMKNVLWPHNLFFRICSVIPAERDLVLPDDDLISFHSNDMPAYIAILVDELRE